VRAVRDRAGGAGGSARHRGGTLRDRIKRFRRSEPLDGARAEPRRVPSVYDLGTFPADREDARPA
jgi:hypothetical protein